jgi:hypothetical protein
MSCAHRPSLFVFLALAGATLAGCGRHKATSADCQAILDRIIDLELTESGYRDAVLRQRWKQDLGRRFAADLERCRALHVKEHLRRCVDEARTPEAIVHGCLD